MEVLDHNALSEVTLESILNKLAHGEELSETELMHWGVRGMKWGKRKASAQAKVTANGGKKTAVVVHEVGKMALVNILSNVGVAGAVVLSNNNPNVKRGALIAAGIIQSAAAANTIVNISAIAKADSDQ